MNTRHTYKIAISLLLGSVLSMIQTPVMAAPGLTLQVSQTPLSVAAASVAPNIMLMIDNSGSMAGNGNGTPFTVTATGAPSTMPSTADAYACSLPITAGTASTTGAPVVYMTVNGHVAQFCTAKAGNICSGTAVLFGNTGSAKCFNPTQYYKVTYSSSTGTAGASLGTFIGSQLNWYFSNNSTYTANTLTAVNKIWSRIEMATGAATDLVNSLIPATGEAVEVRMGLATYYNGSQGQLLVPIGDLNATQAQAITNITGGVNGINGFWKGSTGTTTASPNYWTTGDWNTTVSGSDNTTPLAMTLSDIGRYFTLGTTATSLTLHPNTTYSSTDTIANIFNNRTIFTSAAFNTKWGSSLASPVQNFCQKNAVILISDGLPNSDKDISVDIRNYTGDCGVTFAANGLPIDNNNTGSYNVTTKPNTCNSAPNNTPGFPGPTSPITLAKSVSGKNGSKVGRAYESGGSDYLDDVAAALYDIDLRPELDSSAGKHNLSTYTIGIADPNVKAQVKVSNGGLSTGIGTVLEAASDQGGGQGGSQFVFASNYAELAAALNNMVSSIRKGIGSFSALAANSTQLSVNSALFQATYDVSDWTGDFYAWQLGTGIGTGTNGTPIGQVFPTPSWDAGNFIVKPVAVTPSLTSAQAATQATAPTWTNRNIFTYNTTAKGISLKGLTFATGTDPSTICSTKLTATQKTALGISSCTSSSDQGLWRLDFLRGDSSHEVVNSTQKTYTTDPRLAGSNNIFRNRVRFRTTAPTGASYKIGDVWQDPWLLGDIVNSAPAYVGTTENYGYGSFTGTAIENSIASYNTFVGSPAIAASGSKPAVVASGKGLWRPMVYVGANDGFLHGFDANTSGTGGTEVLAYMPNTVFSADNRLIDLSSTDYSHKYFVDGSPKAGDAFFNSAWHTVLVGSTAAGGKGVFALDITNPTSLFATGISSASSVLWEINDSSSPTPTDVTTDNAAPSAVGAQTTPANFSGFANNMGYTLPQPSIGKMNDGSWAAVVANGYSSANGKAVLYILNIQTGAIIATFNTDTGGKGSKPASPDPASATALGSTNGTAAANGLSTPFDADIDGNGTVDVIYAGDVLGNMWKFDVSSTDKTQWKIAYGTPSAPAPLFRACDWTSTATVCNGQPITNKPQVGPVDRTKQKTGVMVYFGTGQYFQDSDNLLTGTQTQSFYGIWDNCALVNTTTSGSAPVCSTPVPSPVRSFTPHPPSTNPTTVTTGLVQQSIQAETTTSPFIRVGSSLTPNYSPTGATQQGWYIDFYQVNATVAPAAVYPADSPANNQGERIVSASLLRGGNIVFVTLIPSPTVTADPCTPGSHSTSWLTELDAVTGAAPAATNPVLDINNSGSVTSADVITVTNIYGQSVSVPASGVKTSNGSTSTPVILSNPGSADLKFTGSSEGTTPSSVAETPASTSTTGASRLSWKQVQ